MIESLAQPERAVEGVGSNVRLAGWKGELRAELADTFVRGGGRWSKAVAAVAWIHLGSFLTCHALFDRAVPRDVRLFYVWMGELAAVLSALRLIAGPRWTKASAAVGIVARLWCTFLILSFNLLSLNELLGWELRWCKPAWGTLSTFFLASMAWLFTPRLFIPAVQMYFTALLMIRFPEQENLIYGVSWWLALLGISWRIRLRERAVDGGVR
jgi:hypothetical protein